MSKKSILITGIISFTVLIVLALLFYKERTIFGDLSLYLFSILKDQTFTIQHNRIGTIAIQIFPVTAMKLGCSLNTTLIVYSLSFIIFYCSVFLTIILFQKNTRIALAYLLFVLLITAHTFYWIQSELPVAVGFLFVYLAFLDNNILKNKTLKYWLISSLLLFIVSFTHPLMIFAFAFSSLFFLISNPKESRTILLSLFIYFSSFACKYFFIKTTYETGAIGQVQNIISLFPHYIHLKSNENFIKYLIDDYYFLLIGFIVTLVFYILQKSYLKALLVIASCFGYILVVNVTYPQGSDQFYIENQYLLLGIFVGIPLAYDVFPALKAPKIFIIALSIMSVLSFVRIYNAHSMYTTRLNWLRMILKTTDHLAQQKLIIKSDNIPHHILLMDWACCYEFWLLSSIEGKESRSVIIQEFPDEFEESMKEKTKFITKWGSYEYATLPGKYFIFKDTSEYNVYTYHQ